MIPEAKTRQGCLGEPPYCHHFDARCLADTSISSTLLRNQAAAVEWN